MADKGVERSDERECGPGPWWGDLGTWGAVGLIVFGVLVAAWVFFRLPGTPDESASGYYGAAKAIAIGLVVVGSTLLGRRRSRAAAGDETKGRGDA